MAENIKVIQRIPTTQYGYIELNMEYETAEEAFIDHMRLLKMYEGGVGLDAREWKRTREKMLETGQCDPEVMERMNHAQRWFINESKLTLRALTKNAEPLED